MIGPRFFAVALVLVGCHRNQSIPGSHPDRCLAPEGVVPPPTEDWPCTYYVAPNGDSANPGTDSSAPSTLLSAGDRTRPGDVVCLLSGTYSLSDSFYPPHSGEPGLPIVYRGVDPGGAVLVRLGGDSGNAVLNFWEGKHHIEIRGLVIDGRNEAKDTILCMRSHHLTIADNVLINGGSAGFATKFCDYVRVENNLVHHCGYGQGWSSGISLNSQQFFDNCAGFHSYVSGNVVAGCVDESDEHTDGNGIIMDLSQNDYDLEAAGTPPVLIANNVVYQNGGRCIHLFVVSDIWVVNNTCYRNGLDQRLDTRSEISTHGGDASWFINNAVQTAADVRAFWKTDASDRVTFLSNLYAGGILDLTPMDTAGIREVADSQLVDPPPVAGATPWASALDPRMLGDRLTPAPGSPLVDGCVDPRSVEGADSSKRQGLEYYLATDAMGQSRPQGTAFDCGAYERPDS